MLSLKIPPALLVLIFAALTVGLDRLMPGLSIAFPGAGLIAVLMALAALLVTLAGGLAFRRARTTVNPLEPEQASSLVVAGIYHYTRNPMYLGFALLLGGLVVYLGSLPALLLIPAFIAYMNRFQIAPEERALEKLFGESYRDYCARVRRWL